MITRESLDASQAELNEIAAAMIRDPPGDPKLITTARDALRQHNWARRFPFEGTPRPHDDQLTPGARQEIAGAQDRRAEGDHPPPLLAGLLIRRAPVS